MQRKRGRNRGSFRPVIEAGADSRRHVFTQEERSRGGQTTARRYLCRADGTSTGLTAATARSATHRQESTKMPRKKTAVEAEVPPQTRRARRRHPL